MNPQTEILLTGLAFPESPRWRDNRLWFTDQHAHSIMTVTPGGKAECLLKTADLPGGLGWLRRHRPPHRLWSPAGQGCKKSGGGKRGAGRPYRRSYLCRRGHHRRHLLWLSGGPSFQGQAQKLKTGAVPRDCACSYSSSSSSAPSMQNMGRASSNRSTMPQ